MVTKLHSVEGKRLESARNSATDVFDNLALDVESHDAEPVSVVGIVVYRDGALAVHTAGSVLGAIGAIEAAKLQLLIDEAEE